jgi:phage gp45-like
VGDVAVGVSHHTKTLASGEKITFRLKGDIIPMKSAAAVAAGAKLEVAASGQVQTQTTGALFGIAWTASAGANGDLLVIVL